MHFYKIKQKHPAPTTTCIHTRTHTKLACCCVVASETAAAVSVLACEINPGGSVIQQGSEVPIN